MTGAAGTRRPGRAGVVPGAPSRSRASRWHRPAALGATVALLAVLGACTGSGSDERQTVADALAAAITTGDFAGVPLDGATPAEAGERRTAAYAGLDPWTPQVTAADVAVDAEDEDAASTELSFTWDVDASDVDWTYTTHASLVRVDGAWRVRWSTMLFAPSLATDETLAVRRVQAERADVLGAGDAVLVEDRPVFRVGIDKTRVAPEEVDAAARGLAAALGTDADAYAAQVAAAGEKAFVEAIVVRAEDPSYDVATLQALPGVNALSTSLPLAPTRAFARPVLGTVGEATAEIVEASDGAVVAGDLTGLGGLQKQFDARLRGLPGLTVVATTEGSAEERELFHVEPTTGEPLRTTLDPAVQQAAEDVVARVTDSAAAVVAIRPSTGEILAAASGTGGGGMSTATLGLYAPGSTFKIASSLALLRAGLTPDSTVTCPATATVDGRAFSNYPGYPADALGDITLRTAVAESCNTAFLTAAGQVPQQALADAASALGLVDGADLGFAAALGSVPADDQGGTDHAASMIGQARVQATPLGMATVAASVVAGVRVVPRLVLDDATSTPEPAAAAPLTTAEADALRSMMRSVVTDGGGDFLQDVPGAEVIAKSGTAQYGSGDELANHAWMIAGYGDLAVAVFVETGDFGSTTSGPLLEDFLRAVPQG